MNIEFKKRIPSIKRMFSEGKNLEEISNSLNIKAEYFYKEIKKYSSEFSDLKFY